MILEIFAGVFLAHLAKTVLLVLIAPVTWSKEYRKYEATSLARYLYQKFVTLY